MSLRVPYFVRRVWRLIEARRALFEGSPERALAALRDPALARSPQASQLRQRAMETLYRSASHRLSEGRDASAARLLGLVAAEDPQRAEAWRRHLGGPAVEPPSSQASDLPALLAQMRSGDGGGSSRPRPASPAPQRAEVSPGAALRFHLAVDDGGEFLVLSGSSITFGHARTGAADVPLLADLESLHARLTFGDSFHGGPTWCVEPVGRGTASVDGSVAEGPLELYDGAEVRLSRHLSFRFRRPDPASASASIDLLRGAEADGAARLLLLAPGAAGRVRIGAKANRHLPVAGIEHEVELLLEPAQDPRLLVVRCEGGARVLDAEAPPAPAVRLPCPPDRRVDVVLGARPAQTAPFVLSLAPVQEAGHGPTLAGGHA